MVEIAPADRLLISGALFSDSPLTLRSGRKLGNIQVAYTLNGKLTREADVILITHALSGDQFVCSENVITGRAGWWSEYVGPGRVFDTNKYCVVCTNVLGGCTGTTGPATPKIDEGASWGSDFPVITIQDMVRVQKEFLRAIGVDHLYAVVGGSMGGMQVLEWLRLFSEISHRYIVIASSYRQPVQNIGFHEIGRRAIMLDPEWESGHYQRSKKFPERGLAIARMVGHMTYLSDRALAEKFGRRLQDRNEKSYRLDEDFQIESYLGHQGSTFVGRFDANSYLYITKAIDYFDQSEDFAGDLVEAYSNIRGLNGKFVDLVGFDSDWLYPSSEMKDIYEAVMRNGGRGSFTELSSAFGHDSFLLPNQRLREVLSQFV